MKAAFSTASVFSFWGKEHYAIELRERTVFNLVCKPVSLSISIEEQLAECNTLDRSSVWYINAETCSDSSENIESNVADLSTGASVWKGSRRSRPPDRPRLFKDEAYWLHKSNGEEPVMGL